MASVLPSSSLLYVKIDCDIMTITIIETHIKSNCSVKVGFLILNGTHTHI